MHGIDLVSPSVEPGLRSALDELVAMNTLPPPYVATSHLTTHLEAAVSWLALSLTQRDHVNTKRAEAFECASYYNEMPSVVAFCARIDGRYVATMGSSFVRRMVKVCHLVAPGIRRFVDSDFGSDTDGARAQPSAELDALLEGEAEVSEEEADLIVAAWPDPNVQHGEIELGSFALFFDLIRLVWVHEWAHALCGHVDLATERLGLDRMYEFSAERPGSEPVPDIAHPRAEVLQALEAHADEFAARICLGEIFWGEDPVGSMIGRVSLIERLLVFNTACSIFAVIWALQEQKHAPGDTFYPREDSTPGPDGVPRIFKPLEGTHPPAALRYMRFRDFAAELAWQYSHQLGPTINAVTFGFLESTLSDLSPYFHALRQVSPSVAKTPTTKRLIAYEEHLLRLGAELAPHLEELCYVPSAG